MDEATKTEIDEGHMMGVSHKIDEGYHKIGDGVSLKIDEGGIT